MTLVSSTNSTRSRDSGTTRLARAVGPLVDSSNLPLYPKLHSYLRDSAVPVMAVWGRNDEIFGAAGALAFADDAVDAEIHLLDGGHFLLESAVGEVAGLIRNFLGKHSW